MKLRYSAIAIALIGIVYLLNTSCEKKTDCTAVIYCRDSTDTPLIGAAVQLFANVKTPQGGTITADLRASGSTDEAGRVSFIFKLPAIYDIRATTASSLVGTGIIKLEEGKTVEKVIILR
jgi:hypothetical protein